MRVTVSDIRNYFKCPRYLWLKVKGIKVPNVGFSTGRQFHVLVHGITNMIFSIYKLELPGEIIGVEKTLRLGELIGRIDVLRLVRRGDNVIYVIQDEKFCAPPPKSLGRVYPEDKIQLDAYAYLAEGNGYRPLKGIIIYNDLIPREVKLEPNRIPPLLKGVKRVYYSDLLPPLTLSEGDKFRGVEDPIKKCLNCHYYPLCQVLPEGGGVSMEEIRALKYRTRAFSERLREVLNELGIS